MAKGKQSVSFFFPAYYDAKSIPLLVRDFHAAMRKTGRDFEIIIVDDASPDDTGRVADMLAKKFSNVRTVHHRANRGYGGALVSGFSSAKKQLAGFTDGDAQYSVRDLPQFLEAMGNADLVIGYRTRRAEGWKRNFFSTGYRFLLLLLFGLRARDPDCSFKMIRTGLFPSVRPGSRSGFVSAEMIYRAKKRGLRIKQVPVGHYNRPFGTTTAFGMKPVLDVAWDMLRMRFGRIRQQ